MKKIGLFTLLFLSSITYGQKSIYFSTPLPSPDNSVDHVDLKHYGQYQSTVGNMTYTFSESGITITSTTISSISRETIRESSKFDVRGDYLFGVAENDSVPCVLEGERYYFGVRNHQKIINSESENVLTRISSGVYMINFYEGGNYMPAKLTVKNKKANIAHFDYESDTEDFDFILEQKSIEMSYFDLLILKPSADEVKTLMKTDAFSDISELIKIE